MSSNNPTRLPVVAEVGIHRRDDQAVIVDHTGTPMYRVGVSVFLDAVAAEFQVTWVPRDPDGRLLEQLTVRENQVAMGIGDGLTDAQIGGRLNVSPRTVESHVASILAKLGVQSRAQVATMVSTATRLFAELVAVREELARIRETADRFAQQSPTAALAAILAQHRREPDSIPSDGQRAARCLCMWDGPARDRGEVVSRRVDHERHVADAIVNEVRQEHMVILTIDAADEIVTYARTGRIS